MDDKIIKKVGIVRQIESIENSLWGMKKYFKKNKIDDLFQIKKFQYVMNEIELRLNLIARKVEMEVCKNGNIQEKN